MLHKIGITTRPITKRLAEIEYDLRSHYQRVTVKVLGTWCSRGNVEKYFKYKYSNFNYPIGSLTEYFKFDNPEDAISVKRDLERMEPKVLSQVEQKIVENGASPIEEILCNQLNLQERLLSSQTQIDDRRIDYLTEAKLVQVFLASPSSQLVIQALYQGHSLQQAARGASIPVVVIGKVLAVLQQQASAISVVN